MVAAAMKGGPANIQVRSGLQQPLLKAATPHSAVDSRILGRTGGRTSSCPGRMGRSCAALRDPQPGGAPHADSGAAGVPAPSGGTARRASITRANAWSRWR